MVQIDKTTDFMYTINQHGLSLLKFKSVLCGTVYEDKNRQVFYTELGHYVWTKEDDKVYELTTDGWMRMVLQIEGVLGGTSIRYAK